MPLQQPHRPLGAGRLLDEPAIVLVWGTRDRPTQNLVLFFAEAQRFFRLRRMANSRREASRNLTLSPEAILHVEPVRVSAALPPFRPTENGDQSGP
jgi:hypothetical protein